ncbi:MAG: NADH-quinone oxidoreductase subunit A [Ignavibacteriaceae bacterium]
MNNGIGELIWPLVVYGGAVVALVTIMLGLSYLLGQKHEEKETNEPFESGIKVTDSARLRFPIHYYIVAMFFVIFDLEAVFIFTWAISLKQVGWTGYIAATIFIAVLVAVLIYEWRIGALDFGASGKKILKARSRILKESKNL